MKKGIQDFQVKSVYVCLRSADGRWEGATRILSDNLYVSIYSIIFYYIFRFEWTAQR